VLRNIEIRNFRCLRDVNVPLRPLTVLIGPNDSGKSAFLAAVHNLISDVDRLTPGDYWRCDESAEIRIKATSGDETIEGVPRKRVMLHRQETRNGLVNSLRPIRRYQLPAQGVSMECPGYEGEEERELPLGINGERVAALADYLLRFDRERFFAIEESLRSFIPGLESITIPTPDRGSRRIDFRIDGGLSLKGDQMSAGLRLLLFFIALAHHPQAPRTILIEEPENGIHPRRMSDIMSLLRALTQGKHGAHASQIIMTTHSPYLLDWVDLNEDQVLVFRRNDDGSRGAEPVDAERMKNFLDEFMLGEVWFNQEESGLVAKQ
jgi:predicted ATPase